MVLNVVSDLQLSNGLALVAWLIIILILFFLIWSIYNYPAFGLQMKTYNYKHYTFYDLIVNSTINGHKQKLLLDTGSGASCVSTKVTHNLHLDKLPQSNILPKIEMWGVMGNGIYQKAVDVTMTIDNSPKFHTQIQLDCSDGPSLLSIHDLIKAFS